MQTKQAEEYLTRNLIWKINKLVSVKEARVFGEKCGLSGPTIANAVASDPGNATAEIIKRIYNQRGADGLAQLLDLMNDDGHVKAVELIVSSPCALLFGGASVNMGSSAIPKDLSPLHFSNTPEEKYFKTQLVFEINNILNGNRDLYMSAALASGISDSRLASIELSSITVAEILLSVYNQKGASALRKFVTCLSESNSSEATRVLQAITNSPSSVMFFDPPTDRKSDVPLIPIDAKPADVKLVDPKPIDQNIADDASCCVCMAERKTRLFTQCNHMCVCDNCVAGLSCCPICRTPGATVRVFW